MDEDLKRWAERLGPVVRQTDAEAAALEAGIETWGMTTETPEPEGAPAAGQAGFLDPRTGDGLVTTAFPPAPSPPADYPAGWPFLPFVQAWMAEIRLGDAGSIWSLAWQDVLRPAVAAEHVVAALLADGWARVPTPDAAPPPAPGFEFAWVGLFRLGGRIRILMRPSEADAAAPGLMLMDHPDRKRGGAEPSAP
jgi:hypothetical protein